MMRKIAILGICLLAVLLVAQSIIFYHRHDYSYPLTFAVYLFWIALPATVLFLTQRFFKNATYKYNAASIINIFLFFSLMYVANDVYNTAYKPLSRGEIFYREKARVLTAAKKWITHNANYGETFKLINENFSTMETGWQLPVEEVEMPGKKVSCYYVYLKYQLKNIDGKLQTEQNFFWLDMDYNVVGITMDNVYTIPVQEEDILLDYWKAEYGYTGP